MDYEKISFTKKPHRDDEKNSEISIKIKNAILLFIVFILLSTDVFIDQVLARFDGAVDGMTPTSTGVLVQAIFLIIGYILIEALTTTSII